MSTDNRIRMFQAKLTETTLRRLGHHLFWLHHYGIKLPAKVSIQVAWNVYGVVLNRYTYLYISIYIYILTQKHIYIYIYIYIYIPTYACKHIHVHTHTHTHICIYIYIYIYIYIHTHIHIHTDMWVDIKFYERPFTHCGLVMPFIGIDPCQTLAQEVACCLMAPSHGLDQCCHVINNDVYFTKWQQHCKCTRMWSLRNIQIAFEIPRRQWVNSLDCVFSSSKYKQNSMIIGWTVSFDQASINKRAWQNSNRTWSNNTCTTHIYRFKLNCISP